MKRLLSLPARVPLLLLALLTYMAITLVSVASGAAPFPLPQPAAPISTLNVILAVAGLAIAMLGVRYRIVARQWLI